jgi:thiol-disulfide isomerase/thioredoxin
LKGGNNNDNTSFTSRTLFTDFVLYTTTNYQRGHCSTSSAYINYFPPFDPNQTGAKMTTPETTNEKVTMESLLGQKLLVKADGGAKHTKTLLKDKDLVGLYFSASWCPPCKTFSPLLREFYNAAAKDGKLEIVYISSDRDVESFKEYVSFIVA